jgi:hypothetical protein
MWMSENQIVTSFRESKHPAAQIKILAQLNDCSPRTIQMILTKHGYPTPQAAKNYGQDVMTGEQVKIIRRMREDGASYQTIADAVGTTKRTVRYLLSKYVNKEDNP